MITNYLRFDLVRYPERTKLLEHLLQNTNHDTQWQTVRLRLEKAFHLDPGRKTEIYLGDSIKPQREVLVARIKKTIWKLFAVKENYQEKIIFDLVNNIDGGDKKAIGERLKAFYGLSVISPTQEISIVTLRF
jgi:hypothetical protein